MTREDRSTQLWWLAIAVCAPVGVAAVLVAVRDVMVTANLALVLVVVVVAVAAAGGREAGAIAAVVAAVSFDFFLTKPYLQLRIASDDDLESAILLLVVGLLVGTVAGRARRARDSAQTASTEIARIHRLADRVALGEAAAEVILQAQTELTELLDLRECWFEAAPFSDVLPRLERNGTLSGQREHHYVRTGFELPLEGVELVVLARGQQVGRFVLVPTAGVGVSLEQRVVAVALADQIGGAISGGRLPSSNREGNTNNG